MKPPLEEAIRRFSSTIDGVAPPIEELLPPDMAEHLGLERRPPTVTTRLVPVTPARRAPGWAIALAVAAVVILLAIPVILLTTDDPDVVATTPPTTVPVSTTIDPVVTEPTLHFDRGSGRLSGQSWSPGATVTATLGDIERTAIANTNGTFVMDPADFVRCCFDLLVVTDGTTTIRIDDVPDMEVTRVEPATDIIAGISWDGPDVLLTILGGNEPFETTATPIENGWFVDLSDEFDLVPGMRVEARAVFPEITVSHSTTERISAGARAIFGRNELVGEGFSPQSPLTVTVDGSDSTLATGTAGEFSVAMGDLGLELTPGQSISVTDGISTVTGTVPLLTYEDLDTAAGLASGAADLPDGTELYFELWMSDEGSSEANEYFTTNVVVNDGLWTAAFEPLPDGWTVVESDVGRSSDGLGVATLFTNS